MVGEQQKKRIQTIIWRTPFPLRLAVLILWMIPLGIFYRLIMGDYRTTKDLLSVDWRFLVLLWAIPMGAYSLYQLAAWAYLRAPLGDESPKKRAWREFMGRHRDDEQSGEAS